MVHNTPPVLAAIGQPGFILPCGCKVEMFNHHGIRVTYCERHSNFLFSPRYDGSDVFYFVTEENQP